MVLGIARQHLGLTTAARTPPDAGRRQQRYLRRPLLATRMLVARPRSRRVIAVAQVGTLSVRHSTVSAQRGGARTGTKGRTPCATEGDLKPSA